MVDPTPRLPDPVLGRGELAGQAAPCAALAGQDSMVALALRARTEPLPPPRVLLEGTCARAVAGMERLVSMVLAEVAEAAVVDAMRAPIPMVPAVGEAEVVARTPRSPVTAASEGARPSGFTFLAPIRRSSTCRYSVARAEAAEPEGSAVVVSLVHPVEVEVLPPVARVPVELEDTAAPARCPAPERAAREGCRWEFSWLAGARPL
jgi:hypothetical protein